MSISSFANQMNTLWGSLGKQEPGKPPSKNVIPSRIVARDHSDQSRGGNRYLLSEKVCGAAIVKANIVMIINSHFKGRRQPK